MGRLPSFLVVISFISRRRLRILKLFFVLLSLSFIVLCLLVPKKQLPYWEIVYVLEPGFPLIRMAPSSAMYTSHEESQHSLPLKIDSTVSWPSTQAWLPVEDMPGDIKPFRYDRCNKLLTGSSAERRKAQSFMANNYPLSRCDMDYIQETRNCSNFLRKRGYLLDASEREKQFPLAFSMIFYKDLEQMERLLRAVYRPHNVYCIHLDKKSHPSTWKALRGLVSCFPNVFLASRSLDVEWGTFSVLEPELVCMEDLWAKKSWRYFINLTGQEFPLKTNLQLVNILAALNGSNDVDCTTSRKWEFRWKKQLPAPHGIQPRKGNLHIAVTREFVDYVLHSDVAKDYLKWLNTTLFPDETFFSSFNHNPHLQVPGSYLGPPDTNPALKPYLSRFKNWGEDWIDTKGRYIFYWPCYGKRVRYICVFGVGDLPMLTSRKELFANKLFIDYEPLTLDCLEEWLWNITMDEYSGRVHLDVSFYKSLDSVRNHAIHDSKA